MKLTKNELLALLITPLATPVFFTAFLALPGISEGKAGIFDTFLLATEFGLPIAYVFEAVIGLPVLFLVRKIQIVNIWSLSIGGAAIAMLPIFLLLFYANNTNTNPAALLWQPFLVFGLCGAALGMLFWYVAYYRPQQLTRSDHIL